MAYVEKAEENLSMLVEEQKSEQGETLKKIMELEMELDDRRKVEVIKHLVNDDDATVQRKLKEVTKELDQKIDDINYLEEVNEMLAVRQIQSNEELMEARTTLISALLDTFGSKCTNIGIKMMGEIDDKAFVAECKRRFTVDEALMKASEGCWVWEDEIKDPKWHPFRIIENNGKTEEVINENDEKLKKLKEEWGDEAYKAVVVALQELNEYNP